MKKELAVTGKIESKIFFIRGKNVMLDRDLAELYAVPTKRINEAVKRNKKRFPQDFIFQLSRREMEELVANCDRFASLKHSSSNPYAFTEHGVAMLSSVLSSDRAVKINIQIIKTFVAVRQYALKVQGDENIAGRLGIVERALLSTDKRVDDIILTLNAMLEAEEKEDCKKIGFV
ncbi:MAG: ORF6N domain-containing protein [Elusimicrobium sp.]|nr:ORF6N domain-containing protein [Elusimicrobium sp.]